ncbi:SA1362 family protein [Lentibacillus juripiscarius]|uniref:SA1362 family protein n=1 Tax=Lentibacillus juripiscarius TaxID=257446 RepID=A0ABW5V274_9BACI
MVRNKFSLLVYAIIGLAVIGVITQLFTNTASFLTSILTMVGFAAAIFAVIYFFVFRKGSSSSNDAKKYKQAVKQSKSKYSQKQAKPTNNNSQSQPSAMKKKLNKRASHLRVIDGNKSKRKNRASF